ncbi:MAG: hypothetical protein VW338_03475 [Rhodospirillaceae bacterium]
MNITVKDTATPKLKALAKKLDGVTISQAAGKAVQVLLVDHFKDRQAEGNKQGWPSQGFWYGVTGSVANATAVSSVTKTTATVSIADARFALRLFGGTITPKRKKALTIPLIAEAYALQGKGSIKDLIPGSKIIQSKERAHHGFIVTEQEDGNLKFWFLLVKKTTHAPDRRALPKDAEIEQAAARASNRAVQLLAAA